MRDHEAMLSAQAVALNAIFGEFARRAAVNMGEHIGAMETYARLAMKAQSQCRSTIETLAEMKNPPVVFARQANISNGPQQVNNGITTSDAERSEQARARAYGRKANRADRTTSCKAARFSETPYRPLAAARESGTARPRCAGLNSTTWRKCRWTFRESLAT